MLPCTGVILAGGENKRLPGVHKAFLEIGGITIVDRILKVYRSIFDDIIIVARKPELFLEKDALVVTDIVETKSSLSGIHAGLFYSGNDHIFVSACDSPFINGELIKKIVGGIDGTHNIIVPETENKPQPLFAVYSKRCMVKIDENLKEGNLHIRKIFTKKRTKIIKEDVLKKYDEMLYSFVNINTDEDLKRAKDLEKNIRE